MDVLYQYGGLEFVWDIRKAAANLEKHGIRFEQACEVFVDPLAVIVDAAVEDEARRDSWRNRKGKALVRRTHRARSRRHPHHLSKSSYGSRKD